jgi:dimethylhistidine N-methyltransferase/ergothioneine biosynthesis protein EgtC
MCRHLVYLGEPATLAEVLTEPPRSLYRQSWAPTLQHYGTVNADGFGVGWYPITDADGESTEPALGPTRYRRSVPIWTDGNLRELTQVVRAGAVLAAVRDATAGTSHDESAAAPFRDGPWLFSHNGAVADWRRLPEETDLGLGPADLLGLESLCDSALLWAAVAARLRRGETPQHALAQVVRQVSLVRPGARLNFLLTDGRSVAATRHGDTLWYRAAPGGLVVASEPDDESALWREVPEDSVLQGDVSGVSISPIGTPDAAPAAQSASAPPDDRFSLDRRLPEHYFADALRADALSGLTSVPRSLPPKWFYDAHGSTLFEEITRLPEYYPTRAETQILARRAEQIAARTRADTLVELGAGSSRKTRLLLDALTAAGTLTRYAPLDVSESALREAGAALCRDYPRLRVTATVTDFEAELALPPSGGPRLIAFLGSTIGNLGPEQRDAFFSGLRAAMDERDAFLLGADLVKDAGVLWRAYNDSQGVTAAFNKNVLQVLNRELDADFDLDEFAHRAVWNAEQQRIEMWLRSRAAQSVKVRGLDLTLEFEPGEELLTEISTKFEREALTGQLASAGLAVREWWTDAAGGFALLLATPAQDTS